MDYKIGFLYGDSLISETIGREITSKDLEECDKIIQKRSDSWEVVALLILVTVALSLVFYAIKASLVTVVVVYWVASLFLFKHNRDASAEYRIASYFNKKEP